MYVQRQCYVDQDVYDPPLKDEQVSVRSYNHGIE